MKKKAVSILCMVAMSIGSLGTEVVCAAESDFVLAKDPEDYKLTIYWPAQMLRFPEYHDALYICAWHLAGRYSGFCS